MTMAFAIDEINKNPNLLPNVTLGYSLSDNCGALVIGFSGALSLASGREEQFLFQQHCLGTPPILGIVGDSPSTFSIATSNVLGLYKMPIVSLPSSFFIVVFSFLTESDLHEITRVYTVCLTGKLFFYMFLPE